MSKVFFTSADVRHESLLHKLRDLLTLFPINAIIDEKEKVAVKVHMGTRGCTRYLRPIFVKEIVNAIQELGAHPFVTDTTTLYPGDRWSPAEYYNTARLHGFVKEVLGCPVSISDNSEFQSKDLPTRGRQMSQIEVAGGIAEADSLVIVSHAKGHDLAGFGGAIKNVGMGCLTKKGKSKVHSVTKPSVILDNCIGCGVCVDKCPWGAITISQGKAFITEHKCRGCTSCIYSCSQGALYISLEKKTEFQRSLANAASAIVEAFEGKVIYINFVTDVTPVCDCAPFSNLPIVPDIGILASTDIVAIDKTSLDLIDNAPVYPRSILDKQEVGIGKSKFQVLHGVDPFVQVYAAQELGLGSTASTLINIDEIK